MKKVSVVVATYRRDEDLKRALNSLASQSYQNIEIVLVDDNGDEEWNTKVFNIVNDFKANHSTISLQYIVNTPNQGSAKTRNIGIEAATGEYITFLDDDDLYLPTKIQNQLELMSQVNADYSLMNLKLYYENETISEIRRRDYLLTNESNNLLLCHLKYHMTGTDTMMFTKEYLTKIGCFDPIDIGDEFYLMMKAIENKGKFVYCNVCDVKAYVHKGNDGLSSGQQKIDGEKKLYNFKKHYFDILNSKNKRYIKMRHHAVLAFAYKRSGKTSKFCLEALKSIFTAPIQCISLIRGLKCKK